MLDQIFMLFASVAGPVIIVVIMAFIYRRDAIHWRYLAERYGWDWSRPTAERWGNLVLYGKYPVCKSYNCIAKIGVQSNGLALKVMMPPMSFFCRPLFIPFTDLEGWEQTWFLNAPSVELTLKNAPEVKIVMPRDQLEWIRNKGGSAIEYSATPSPYKAKPVFWHTFIIALSVFMLFGTSYIFLTSAFH